MPTLATIPDLPLENGGVLREPTVAYDSWGSLNAAGDNAIIVCHSLTNDSDALSWWASMIGPGCALDTDRYFVICLNVLGSPYGSTSPVTKKPDSEDRYAAEFPSLTIRDTVRAHRSALRRIGVEEAVLAIGGSMGGMQVLEWAFQDEFVRTLAPIAVGGYHSPWGIAWTEAQRRAIYSDPRWLGGAYPDVDPPIDGLATARMMAMISYRAAGEFSKRFGRSTSARRKDGRFNVETYLHRHGEKLVDRFDANCYVHLTKQMNTHDVSRGRGEYEGVLAGIHQPTLVVGISSDVLYPLAEQEELASLIPNAELHVLHAPYGHDSFLIEAEQIARIVRRFVLTSASTYAPA